MSTGRKITLISSDGAIFLVDEEVALVSQRIKDMIEGGRSKAILHFVTSNILSRVIDFCKKHIENPNSEDEDLKAWDSEFVKVDQPTLFDLIAAANDLEIKSLLCLALERVGDMVEDAGGD